MTADSKRLDELAERLLAHGVAGFCPTTLSASPKLLLETVGRLGHWIESRKASTGRVKVAPLARPLGIHIEGPFISPGAAGAHPTGVLRAPRMEELRDLWDASRGTIKIITMAPETLGSQSPIPAWARSHKIILSAGHTKASQSQATAAFDAGFRGVTHAWNASSFHQRSPGMLGAALGRKGVFLEIIPDGVHVDPTVIRWTRMIHPKDQICFVSDSTPAAGLTEGQVTSFGPLQVCIRQGASRLPDGQLAGGGMLLPEAYRMWIEQESKATGVPIRRLHSQSVGALHKNPLKYLGFSGLKQH